MLSREKTRGPWIHLATACFCSHCLLIFSLAELGRRWKRHDSIAGPSHTGPPHPPASAGRQIPQTVSEQAEWHQEGGGRAEPTQVVCKRSKRQNNNWTFYFELIFQENKLGTVKTRLGFSWAGIPQQIIQVWVISLYLKCQIPSRGEGGGGQQRWWRIFTLLFGFQQMSAQLNTTLLAGGKKALIVDYRLWCFIRRTKE